MANSSQALPLTATICFLALLGFVHCHDQLYVEGKVYCDTCRAMFVTRLSEYMDGARVQLECRGREEAGNVTYTIEGVCDTTGTYRLPVEGDHEDDICEVTVLKSTVPDCDEVATGRERARVVLTSNNGIVSDTRLANPLGFLKKEALPGCSEVLKEMGLLSQMIIS